MVLLKGLAAIVSLASIATCSPLDSEVSSGAVGVPPALGLPAIPAVAPLDHALGSGKLPHMPADLATGQLAPHPQQSKNHNGQVAIEKLDGHKGIETSRNVHDLSLFTTEEKTLAPAPAPKLAIREVIERGIANIGARSDPPAQSFIQALGNMFSELGKDKGKRDAPPALPAPPGPNPGAVNASILPNDPDPAAGIPPPSQNSSPTSPAPAIPAPAPAGAQSRVYSRRGESSASAGASDDPAGKKASASDTSADDKLVKSDDTVDSTPAAQADIAESSAESKPKEKPDTESAEKRVKSKDTDRSKDNTAEKTADSKASKKSKAITADLPADEKSTDDKPASKSDATKPSAEAKAAAKDDKNMGSMPAGLDSSFAMSGAKDLTPKKHDHHAPKAHKKSGKSHHSSHGHSKSKKTKAKAPAYKPRPNGQRRKPKSRKPSVSDHHSSHFNLHHKMIPQIARRHELQLRNADAEADAWADAYANYLNKRNVYAEFFAKREAYTYPEPWACSDPSGCN
ncbi:hypothetical protein MMC17_006946 [Xylographa soralifera]|nr:hypothetical protein [Xylographa soralifera]